jgi:beta-galactosidase
MIEKLAQHYGPDKRIMGWQLDNEPRPAADYGEVAQQRFRDFLKNRYQTIEHLNKAWGTAFWSQVYSDFSQINIPQLSARFMNPHQILDYQRFITDEMVSFLDAQAQTIRQYALPYQWITSNYIPEYTDGHLRASNEQDFPSYTRYMVYGEKMGIGSRGYRLGPVERIAMANDFFRPVRDVYGVMELQPGQVNWGQVNPQPLPGAVRLWLWHVFAGGSKFTCTYRFRAPIYGTEMYHYGIVGTDGITPTPGGLEFKKFIEEIKLLRKAYNPLAKNNSAYEARRTAILYDHENSWDMERNKQTTQWNTLNHVSKYYTALKSFGCPVDFIEKKNHFELYKVIIAPAYEMIDSSLLRKWTDYVKQGGNLVLSCRTGYKDINGHLWEAPYAAPIYPLIGAKIDFYDLPLPETPNHVLFGDSTYTWTSWGEVLSTNKETEIWGKYVDDFYQGKPAITFYHLGKGTVTYIGVDSREGKMEKEILRKLYSLLSIPLENLPDGLNIEYRDGFGIAVNYGDKTCTLPLPNKVKYLIGGKTIPTAGVSVWVED